jgi:threonyl-tRNA synthetase
MSISEKYSEYSTGIYKHLRKAGIRVTHDERAEKIGYKIREAEFQKIPYMVIVGEKEITERKVSVRQHKQGEMGMVTVSQFVDLLQKEIAGKTIIK